MNAEEQKLLEARLADCVRLGEKRPAFLASGSFRARGGGSVSAAHTRGKLDVFRRMARRGARDARRLSRLPCARRIAFSASRPDGQLSETGYAFASGFSRFLSGAGRRPRIARRHSGRGGTRGALCEDGACAALSVADREDWPGRVRIREGFDEPLPAAHTFQPVSGVVASERLDCLVALLPAPAASGPRR